MMDSPSTQQRSRSASDRRRFLARRVEQNRQDSQPVVNELRQAGFEVEWVSELFNRPHAYEAAIPILLHWLPKVHNEAVQEAIVRALSVKWAKPEAARPLIEAFPQARTRPLKWAIGNALWVVADDSVFEEIATLVNDPKHGTARQGLVAALGNMKDPRAVDLARTFLCENEFAGYAAIALGTLNDPGTRPELEPLLEHRESWVRREAKRAIAKIDRKTRRVAKGAKHQ